jgi:GT2 family glycosyltransferase
MASVAVSVVQFNTPVVVLQRTLMDLAQAARSANVTVHLALAVNSPEREADCHALADAVRSPAFSIDLITGQGNVGYGRANNLAQVQIARHGEVDAVLILNPDAFLQPQALSAGLAHLARHPECVLVAGRGVDAQGSDLYLCRRWPTLWVLALRGFAPNWLRGWFDGPQSRLAAYERRLSTDPPLTQTQIGVDQASGAAMLIRPAAWCKTRFDERYFLHFEDIDLCRRLGAVGRVDYVPDFCIVHLGGNTSRRGLRMVMNFVRSGIRYFNDWGWRLG